MRIAYVETEGWAAERIRALLPEHEITFDTATAQEANLATGIEALSVFVNSRINKTLLEKWPELKLIVTRSTGFDHIDLPACRERGITVCNVPSYGERTVAEYTFALLLALSRKLYQALRRVHEEGKFYSEGLKGFDLAGKTLGVVGTGRIGCHVIQIAKGFEMRVLAHDPFPKPELEKEYGAKYVSLEELLGSSDVVTLHVPYMPSTHHLISSTNINQIKRGAVLINTARGALVETTALVQALRDGVISAAALDVLEEEGFVGEEWKLALSHSPEAEKMATVLADHQLMSLTNVIISPHNAFNTQEALERILQITADNIQSFVQGSAKNMIKS